MTDKYIRKKDALDAVEARITELLTHPEFRKKHLDISGIIRNIHAIKPADVVPTMNDEAYWTNTDITVWDAKNKDGQQELEISIVTAKCSICGKWCEKIDNYSSYMTYAYCPHCGVKMDGDADENS